MSSVRWLVLISSRVQQCFPHALVGYEKIHPAVNKEEKKNYCRWISWKCYWLVVKILCFCAQNAKGKSPSMPKTLMDERCCKNRFTAEWFLFGIIFIMRSLSIVFFFERQKEFFPVRENLKTVSKLFTFFYYFVLLILCFSTILPWTINAR